MKAAIYKSYGGPETVSIAEMPMPTPKAGQIRVRVTFSSVTTADWRLRAAAFPGILKVAGRAMFGVFGPRNPVLGMEFAGTVDEVGEGVTRFHKGQRVFGFSGGGAHAEYLVIDELGSVVETPDDMDDGEAASLPFGAVCALVFLRDIAKVRPGQQVLVLGASGGVGVYAVQIAKAMGAHVTAVASGARAPLLHKLGAERVLDYRVQDFSDARARYDLVFDPAGVTTFRKVRPTLKPTGLFVPLNMTGREMRQAVWARLVGGPQIKLSVNGDSAEDLAAVLALREDGDLRGVIDRRYALEDITQAHAYVDQRHRKGAVLVEVAQPVMAPWAA